MGGNGEKQKIMGKIKAYELREKKKPELLNILEDLKNELAQLRVAAASQGAPTKKCKMKVIRKSIARVLTVYSEMERKAIRKAYKGSKWKPLDLRKKLTRKLRRKLRGKRGRLSVKTLRKIKNYPKRRYAVRL